MKRCPAVTLGWEGFRAGGSTGLHGKSNPRPDNPKQPCSPAKRSLYQPYLWHPPNQLCQLHVPNRSPRPVLGVCVYIYGHVHTDIHIYICICIYVREWKLRTSKRRISHTLQAPPQPRWVMNSEGSSRFSFLASLSYWALEPGSGMFKLVRSVVIEIMTNPK